MLCLTVLLASCAPKPDAPLAEVRALENSTPTVVPEPAMTAEVTQAEVISHDPSSSCPVTTAREPRFVPPAPYDSLDFDGEFWYGTNSLWTTVRQDGVWDALPHNRNGYTQKVLWWRDGYVWTEEPEPDLIVTGERLDAAAPALLASKATNAYASDIGSAMLVGVDIPTLGCWKITGKYTNLELSFVVWVAP